ncbi:NrfD/PsrC family molybdoenzyme membrane anchor subunit [Parvibacter caecicola]|uniref:NrfD/PsrC family molybdoenzyme membrane anchor subunit n=1 Tax=Parvibacter caecicola TaxID=747645 RepID=UPI002499FD18|nr:NrfD/PsrC family molybdoenzyme membrane anchor subunit [Parvibacter caecicola]
MGSSNYGQGGRVLGELAIVYLFLGGAGAGALLVCALVDLLWLHEPFGIERTARGLSHWPVERLLGLALLAGWLMVACGVVCLAFDLGRIDRLTSLLISPPVSLMNWGAWGLALLLAVGGALVAVRFLCLPWAARGLVTALEVLAAALALFVVAYTGFLLQALAGVRFWGLWPVVLLFVLSALSCGIAVPLLLCAVVPSDEVVESLSGGLLRVDFAVIVTESLTAAVLVAVAAASDHPGIQTSLSLLLRGDAALWWWAFAACGLVIPAAVELLALCSSSGETARRAALCAAAVILAGGVSLRIAIVDAGAFRALELGASPQGEAVAPVAPGPDSSGEGAADYEPKPADAFPFSLQ